jgi:hypothetical protein
MTPQIALRFSTDPKEIQEITNFALQPIDPRPECPLLGVRALRDHQLRLTATGHCFSICRQGLVGQYLDRARGFVKQP